MKSECPELSEQMQKQARQSIESLNPVFIPVDEANVANELIAILDETSEKDYDLIRVVLRTSETHLNGKRALIISKSLEVLPKAIAKRIEESKTSEKVLLKLLSDLEKFPKEAQVTYFLILLKTTPPKFFNKQEIALKFFGLFSCHIEGGISVSELIEYAPKELYERSHIFLRLFLGLKKKKFPVDMQFKLILRLIDACPNEMHELLKTSL